MGKFSALPAVTTAVLATTIIPVVVDMDTVPVSKEMTLANLFNLIGYADGWTPATGAWAYASATTITVPAGATAIYAVGDKVKLTQTTVKYFYVVAVASTLLTITGGSSFTLANAAITLPYYSHAGHTVGFPEYFALTNPAWTTTGTAFTNQPTNYSLSLSISGRTANVSGVISTHATSGGTGVFIATFTAGQLPPLVGTYFVGSLVNTSTLKSGSAYTMANNVIRLALYDGTAPCGNSEQAIYNVSYTI